MSTPIKTLIVDDEPLARERLRDLLKDDPDIELVGECADGAEAVIALREIATGKVGTEVLKRNPVAPTPPSP